MYIGNGTEYTLTFVLKFIRILLKKQIVPTYNDPEIMI